MLEERVSGEVHLGYEAAPESLPEQGEVYVGRAPGVVVVLPGVGPRLDRHEAVSSLVVGQAAAGAGEVGVQRGGMPVVLVDVAAGGVGLPDLDQAVPDRPPVAVRDAPVTMMRSPRGSPSCWRVRSLSSSPTGRARRRDRSCQKGFGKLSGASSGSEARSHVVGIQVRRLYRLSRRYPRVLLDLCPTSLLSSQAFSTTIAIPCPTPMHIVASPKQTSSRRRISCSSVVRMRGPRCP